MLPTVQIKNTLPLHLKLNFTGGRQSGSSLFLGRKTTMNIPFHKDDIFEIVLANNSKITFLSGLQLSSSEIDKKTMTLTIDESNLKSWDGGDPHETATMHTGFSSLNFQLIDSSGNLGKTQDGPDVEAAAGQMFKVTTIANGYELGYMTVGTKKILYGPPGVGAFRFDFNIILHAAMFGTVQGGKHEVVSKSAHLANFLPGVLENDGDKVLLHEGQVILYDKARTGKGDSAKIPDGSNFMVVDQDMVDVSSMLGLFNNFFGKTGFSSLKSMQAGPNTIVHLYKNRNFNGSKTPPFTGKQWYDLGKITFNSLKLNKLETQSQAHMHVMCALAEGLSTDKNNPNPAEFRSTIDVQKVYDAKQKKYVYPNVKIEIANQTGINADFTSINVNGKDYPFDPSTNQTADIAPNSFGKIIATMKPSEKRIGAPHLFIRTSAMPDGAWVTVAPAMTMHQRIGNMADPLGKPIQVKGKSFDQFVQAKSKVTVKGKAIPLSSAQAGMVKSITQSMNKTIVHGFKHTSSGNQTVHVVEGAHFAKHFDSATIDLSDSKNPKFSTVPAGSGTAALMFNDVLMADAMMPEGFFSDLGHALSEATHIVVHAVESAAEAAAKAVAKEVNKVKHAVEKALIVTINKVSHFVIKTAEDIARVATKIYDTVKMAIVDVIDFFKFLISAFEDVPKMFNFVKNSINDKYEDVAGAAQKYVAGNIVKDINKIGKPFGVKLKPLASTSGGHRSSDPGSDKGKEKLHWLLNLIFQEIMSGTAPKGNSMIDGIIKDLEGDIADNLLKFLKNEIKPLVDGKTDFPDNIDSFIKSLFANLETNMGTLVSGTLHDAKDTVEDKLSDIVGIIDQNPFNVTITDSSVIPSFLKGDLLKHLLDLTGLGKILDEITPLNVGSMVYAVPAGIIYAFKKSYDNDSEMLSLLAETDDSIGFSDPATVEIMAMLNDIVSAISATLTVEKAGGGEDHANQLVKVLLMVFNMMNGLTKAAVASKAANDDKGYKEAVNTIVSLRIFAGIWLGIAAIKGSKLPVAKIQCALDVVMGGVGFGYSLYQVANDAPDQYGCVAGMFESIAQMLEIFGFDEEPESRTAAIVSMDSLKVYGAVFRAIELAEN